MGYYSAIKGNEIGTHATTWMNFQNVMLNESHMHKTYFQLPFIFNVQNR